MRSANWLSRLLISPAISSMIRQIFYNGFSDFLFQVLQAQKPFVSAIFYVLREKLHAPHYRQNTNSKFAWSGGGGLANVNMRSLIKLKKRIGKVEVTKVWPVWLWKSFRERSKIVSRCIQRPDVPRGFVDTLFCSQSFRLPRLLICIAKLVLCARIGKPSREDCTGETDQTSSKVLVRRHYAANPLWELRTTEIFKAARSAIEGRVCLRKCQKADDCERQRACNSNNGEPARNLHGLILQGTFSFVEGVAA
jgi:hypothetical protein